MELVSQYRRDGFAVYHGLFAQDEVAQLASEVDRLTSLPLVAPANLRTPHPRCLDDIARLEKFDPVIDISPTYADLARDRRLHDCACELVDSSAVDLFRDKLIIRSPGSIGYPLHQDYSWWHPYDPDAYCTLAVCLSDCNADNGAIQFFPGSHAAPMLAPGQRRPLTEDEINTLAADSATVCEAAAGDVIAFHSLCVHWSGPNLSERTRPILYLSYIRNVGDGLYESHLIRQIDCLLDEMAGTEIKYHK